MLNEMLFTTSHIPSLSSLSLSLISQMLAYNFCNHFATMQSLLFLIWQSIMLYCIYQFILHLGSWRFFFLKLHIFILLKIGDFAAVQMHYAPSSKFLPSWPCEEDEEKLKERIVSYSRRHCCMGNEVEDVLQESARENETVADYRWFGRNDFCDEAFVY